MELLLAHLVGDYVLQNHIMATRKVSSWLWAGTHAFFYGLPFLLITTNWVQWLVIVLTHMVIDRLRLAKLWVDFWGVGCEGKLRETIMDWSGYMRYTEATFENGKPADLPGKPEVWARGEYIIPIQVPPPFLAVWLLIIVDNTLHMCINYAAIRWL